MALTIKEPAREVKVFRETDVAVIGGGPAGVAAALAAARNGADTILVERYGHLGGLATGGLVVLIMPMSDGTPHQQIAGICQEIVDRLAAVGAAIQPDRSDIGSDNARVTQRWGQYPFFVVGGRVRLSVLVDPEILKCILNDMVLEAGIKLCLHSWGTRALIEGHRIQGIIFESKSGRQAILAKTVIDTTGDGDIFASAGASFDARPDPALRSSKMALVFQIANIDTRQYFEFKQNQSHAYAQLVGELQKLGGFTMALRSAREDVLWFNNFLPDLDPLDVRDLTWVEVNVRKKMLLTHDFFRKHMPGFEASTLMNSASQIGVRCSRRLEGEYIITEQDLRNGVVHPDTIAVCPTFVPAPVSAPVHMHIPYRSLVPREIDNLLVAGRCLSADPFANDVLSPIQFCLAMGQAAGTAAALTLATDVTPRDLDYRLLRERLMAANVPLPAL